MPGRTTICLVRTDNAPVAQPDRVVASEAIGRGFESLQARQLPHFKPVSAEIFGNEKPLIYVVFSRYRLDQGRCIKRHFRGKFRLSSPLFLCRLVF